MYCVRKVTEDLYWVGANDHRLFLGGGAAATGAGAPVTFTGGLGVRNS